MSVRIKRFLLTSAATFGAAVLAPVVAAQGLTWNNDVYGSVDSGNGTRFASSQISLDMPWMRTTLGGEKLETDVYLEYTSFRWSGVSAAEGDYFWLSVPVFYRQKRAGNNELHLRIEPGLMTDLDSLGTDSLGVNAEISGRSYLSNGSFLQYGVIVNRTFGDFKPRPLFAWATKITQDTELLLGFPKTNLQTRWGNGLSTYARFYPDGGQWRENVALDAGVTATGSDISEITYRNWRLGTGVELQWQDNIWFNAEIGQLRNRQIEARDSTGTTVKATPGQNGYWGLGVLMRF